MTQRVLWVPSLQRGAFTSNSTMPAVRARLLEAMLVYMPVWESSLGSATDALVISQVVLSFGMPSRSCR